MSILAAVRKIIQERKSVSAFLIEHARTWNTLRTGYPDAPEGTYQRYVIECDEDIEIVLIVWGAGANTGFHGHPDGGCWLSVFEGPFLIEDLPRGISNKICGGYRAGLVDQHSIRAPEPAASIHVYIHNQRL
jgi:hypothetical protein